MNKHLIFLCFTFLFSAAILRAQTPRPVHFNGHSELFLPNYKAEYFKVLPAYLPEDTDIFGGRYYRLIQFGAIPTSSERMHIQSLGVQFHEYIHFGAYLVSIPNNFDWQLLSPYDVVSVQTLLPAWKWAKTLVHRPFGNWAVVGENVKIIVNLMPNLSADEMALRLKDQNCTILSIGKQSKSITLQCPITHLDAIAALPYIKYMELIPPPPNKEDTGGRVLHRSNLLDTQTANGLQLDGSGLGVLVRDDGVVGPHIDFKGRLYNIDADTDDGTHGDGVAGIMSGAGNLNPNYRGMAAGADTYVIDYEFSFEDNTLELHLNEGVKVTNSSYSDGCNDGYTTAAQTVDRQLFENPSLMHFFSAGNSNNVNCDYGAGAQWGNITGGHKQSKNSISSANLRVDGEIATSSSRGPAHDGRLKPDIAAHGQNQISAEDENTYQTFGGTSAASPGTAGVMAQLYQAYKNMNAGADAPTALLKAAMLNTANDLGNPGPDYIYGYGHLNAFRAYQLLAANHYTSSQVDQGQVINIPLQVPSGVRLAKVMIYWSEFEATQLAAKTLVNDLNMRVLSPNGMATLPLRLNPTPIPVLLGAVAAPGVDSLNNSEQVTLLNPQGGGYTVEISGFEIPLGPQPFYVVYEYITDEIKLVHPNGSQALVPGNPVNIQWDAVASTFESALEYSIDGGQNWLGIANVPAELRMYQWTIPASLTNKKVLFKVSRNGISDESDNVSAVAPVPSGITVTKVCPTQVYLSYNALQDSLDYDLYLLGNKYMEIKTTTPNNYGSITITNPAQPMWFSVGAILPSGEKGQRANAIYYPGGLLNCQHQVDMVAKDWVSPSSSILYLCGDSAQALSVNVINTGQAPMIGATCSYQINNGAVISEPLPNIEIGQLLTHTFSATPIFASSGSYNLKAWVSASGDMEDSNDTITLPFQVVFPVPGITLTEGFEGESFPPDNWSLLNPDDNLTWEVANATGINSATTKTARVNHFSYENRGAFDYLFTKPVDLSDIEEPTLIFDVAHRIYDESYSDGLEILVYDNCDLVATPSVIYSKFQTELSTFTPSSSSFTPTSANQWRTEIIGLDSFIGKKVVVAFKAINDFGNNTFIDNINILPGNFSPPLAEMSATNIAPCIGEDVVFTNNSSGTITNYAWQFGTGAVPATSTAVGPITVKYNTGGAKIARLIVSNALSKDTFLLNINVKNNPISNFGSTVLGSTVTFMNNSSYATSYLWMFGDGNISTETSPVHNYGATGTYSVTLDAINTCTTKSIVKNITIATVSTSDLPDDLKVEVLPNPNNGKFSIRINCQECLDGQLQLWSSDGRPVGKTTFFTHLEQQIDMQVPTDTPQGIYFLHLNTDRGEGVYKVVIAAD